MTNMHEIVTGNKGKPHDLILEFLDLSRSDFNRYRDFWFNFDKKQIEIYTRCGGGNREHNQEVFDRMIKHPLYIRDEDNEEDCTYCSFYFEFPKTKEFLIFLDNMVD